MENVALFAMTFAGKASSDSLFLHRALDILLHLQGSEPLQGAVFRRCSEHCQQRSSNRSSLVEAILQTKSHYTQEKVSYNFCISQLKNSLHEAAARDRLGKPEMWQCWIDLADKSNNAEYLELVLRYALSCACGSNFFKKAIGAGDLPPPADWREQCVEPILILRCPRFWQKALQIARCRSQTHLAEILLPLTSSLKTLAHKIAFEALTAREILDAIDAGSLEAWKQPDFLELLKQEKPGEEFKLKLERMIRKISFVREFDDAIQRKLLHLFPGAQGFGKSLRRAFLKASNIKESETGDPLLSVEMSVVNEEAWSEEFREEKTWWDQELQFSISCPVPTFQSLESAIQTLHVARFAGDSSPLQSLFEQSEAEMTARREMKFMDSIFFMQKDIFKNFQQLSELGEADLSARSLKAIVKHWSRVAPHMVPETLATIQSVTSALSGDVKRIEDRLVAVLRGIQTVEFWHLCRKIEDTLRRPLSNKTIPSQFSPTMQREATSLEAMRKACEDAKTGKGVGLKSEDLNCVIAATERIAKLFPEALGPAALDMAFSLVASMADDRGLAFLSILLSSVRKGEHLATRLAELVEGEFTEEKIHSVEQASVWFVPLCVAILAALHIRVDDSKFEHMVGTFWSLKVRRSALGARSQLDLGALMLELFAEAFRHDGNKLSERIESLRSALRCGLRVQQKLQENLDDATAISNTVHGMVTAGHLELSLNDDAMHVDCAGVFTFNRGRQLATCNS